MSKKTTAFIVLSLLAFEFHLHADTGSDIKGFFQNFAKQISDSFDSFFGSDTLKTMGEVFGIVPEDYVYSYAIWNDSNVPVYSSQQSMTSFMGATFPNALGSSNQETIAPWLSSTSGQTLTKTLKDSSVIPAISDWQDTPGTLTVTNEQMLFNLYISDKNPSSNDITLNPLYLDQIQSLDDEASTKVYHYRVYNSRDWSNGAAVHVPKVELLGYSQSISPDDETTPAPTVTISETLNSMVFFNNTADEVKVTFTYASAPLSLILEAYSFNCVSLSDATMSLRPNSFSFYELSSSIPFQTVPFAKVGIADHTYTLEIYQDAGSTTKSVGLQGLSTGNYDMPVSERVRDVTPINCTFWWQSLAQYATAVGLSNDQATSFLNLPGQVWMVYDSVDSPIMSKVTTGGAISWNMVRPTLAKGEDYVYFVYIQTTTDSVAQAFISEFVHGSIGETVKSDYKNAASQVSETALPKMLSSLSSNSSTSTLSSDQETETITGALDYKIGSMTDSAGTLGYLIGGDYFASYGLGNAAQYYILSPSMYNISSLVSNFSMYITPPSSLQSDLQQWVASYVQSPTTVRDFVKNLLITNGSSKYALNGALTNVGNDVVETLLTGPVSLQNPSIDMTPVQNQYVYSLSSSAPTGMPTPQMVASTPIPKPTTK